MATRELEHCAQVCAWNPGDDSVQRWDDFGICTVLRVFRVDESKEEENAGTGR